MEALSGETGLVAVLVRRFERERGRAVGDAAGDWDSSLVIGEARSPFKNLA